MSEDAERALIAEFDRTRDPELRNRICEQFMPLARAMAKRYANGREPLEDLIQTAVVGLLKAIDGYDAERGVDFPAYAAPTMLGELRHYFRDRAADLRIPRGLQESSKRVEAFSEELAAELGREPRDEEISERSGMPIAAVRESVAATHARYARSLDAPLKQDNEEEGTTLVESLASTEAGFERAEAELASQSAALRDTERRVLDLRFHEGLSQREIGQRIGVSQMQVSRLMRRSLVKVLTAVRGEDPAEADGRLTSASHG